MTSASPKAFPRPHQDPEKDGVATPMRPPADFPPPVDFPPPDSAVRDSFKHLPLQGFWTWLSGKPASGQQPLWTQTSWTFLSCMLATLVVGVLLGALALWSAPFGLPLLIPGWLLIVSGARGLQASVVHYAVHSTFSRREWVNTWVGEFVSTWLMLAPFPEYRREHRDEHHGRELATEQDPDVIMLRHLGFEPGTPFKVLWRRLWTTPFSPLFHWRFLSARVGSNFGRKVALRRRLAAAGLVAAQLVAVAVTGTWMEFLLLWMVPLSLVYHTSALMQFASEHLWLRVNVPGESRALTLQRLTAGRFSGEAAPGPETTGFARVIAWMQWLARMMLIHLPARLFVLPGDLPQHDWHHRHARGNWKSAVYERQRDIDAGRPNYSEVWGLGTALKRVFMLWSELPQLPPRNAPSKDDSRSSYLGM